MVVACPECGVTVNGEGEVHTNKPSPPSQNYTERDTGGESAEVWKEVKEQAGSYNKTDVQSGAYDAVYVFTIREHTCANGHKLWTTDMSITQTPTD